MKLTAAQTAALIPESTRKAMERFATAVAGLEQAADECVEAFDKVSSNGGLRSALRAEVMQRQENSK